MKKRGLSEIIVTIILILLILVAIAIIWFFINNLLQKNKETIPLKETLILQRMDIKSVSGNLIVPDATGVKVVIAREASREKYVGTEIIEKKADIVFIIDSTFSMQPQIDAVKSITEDFADELNASSINARLGLIEFRDYNTSYCGTSVNKFATKVHNLSASSNFTTNVSFFKDQVGGINVIFGGDFPEAHLSAINDSLSLKYDPDAKKIIIMLSDAQPHAKDCTCANQVITTPNIYYSLCYPSTTLGVNTTYPINSTGGSCYMGPPTVSEMTDALVSKGITFYYLNTGYLEPTPINNNVTSVCMNRIIEKDMTSRTGGAYFRYGSTDDVKSIIVNLANIINAKYESVIKIDHLKLVFYNDTASYIAIISNPPLKSFDTNTYSVDLTNGTRIPKITNVKRVEVYSVLKTKGGEEVVGPVTDVWKV